MITSKQADAMLGDSLKVGAQAFEGGRTNAQNDKDRALKELLQGRQEQAQMAQLSQRHADDQSNFARDRAAYDELRDKTGKDSSVHVGQFSSGGDNSWFKQATMQNHHTEKVNKDVETMGKRVEQQDIPSAVNAAQDAMEAMPPDGQPFKSAGPYLNAVPNWGVNVAEGLGFLPTGAGRERAAMEAMKGLVRKPLYGSALSSNEKGSFETAYGAPIGGSEDDIRAANKRMMGIPAAALKNIEASTPQEAVGQYGRQGGLTSGGLSSLIKGPQAAPAQGSNSGSGMTPEQRRARIAELKAKGGQ